MSVCSESAYCVWQKLVVFAPHDSLPGVLMSPSWQSDAGQLPSHQ